VLSTIDVAFALKHMLLTERRLRMNHSWPNWRSVDVTICLLEQTLAANVTPQSTASAAPQTQRHRS
jgi:hypothetical protein